MLRYVECSDGVRVAVQDVGSGDPVVLLPGFGLDHRVWDRQVRILAPSRRVVCMDPRGHGTSDKPFGGYEMDRLAQDILEVLEELALERVALVGWSFAGQTAFRAAAMDSSRLRRLVLVVSNAARGSRSETFPFGRPPEVLEGLLVAAELADRLTARRETIASSFLEPPPDGLLDWLVMISLSMPSWAAEACYHTMFHTDLIEDIPRVTLPVTQIFGAEDRVISRKGSAWLLERLAQADRIEVEGCGHWPMFDEPALFDEALVRAIDA